MAKQKREFPQSYSAILEELDAIKKARMADTNSFSDTAMRWYISIVNALYNRLPEDLDSYFSKTKKYSRVMRVGDLMAYGYTAVTKISKHFPYYDRYPIIIVLDMMENHFLGLNLHFLPPLMRQRFFDQCRQMATGVIQEGKADLHRVTYDAISSQGSMMLGKVCVRKYRYDAVRTRMIRIPSDQWTNAINLPTMRLSPDGIPPNIAWKDSMSNARNKGLI